MKKGRWAGCLVTAFLLFSTLFLQPVTAFAEGEGNMAGGGGSFGDRLEQNFWHTGDDGVRVTIVGAEDGSAATTPIDLTNTTPSDIVIHFNKTCKSSYRGGSPLVPNTSTYVYYNPAQMLPRIITSGTPDIEQIKGYFTDEQILRGICEATGFDYNTLVGGDYKLLVEPLAYVTFQGVRTAMTATEAALYNRLLGGTMSQKMPSLSHKNLPLAIFLETSDLGFSAWTGSLTERVSDEDIIASLGVGIVRFTGETTPEAEAVDYVYRVDTDVITAVTISGGRSDPDHPVNVRFEIDGTTYKVSNVYYPKDSSQLAWVKWHTPSTPRIITINISASGDGIPGKTSLKAKVVDLDGNDPPNPTANDRNNRYNARNAVVPSNEENTSANWSVWVPSWHADWKWASDEHGSDCPENCATSHGHWYDDGWWVFNQSYYSASMTGSMELITDEKSPTATASTIKSGYGVNISVTTNTTSNNTRVVVGSQTAVSYFPEFYYKTYWRLLERDVSGLETTYEFKPNPFSTYNRRTHFTPVWMKDGTYKVYTYVMDCWTPGGMLSMNLTDSVTISGDLWKDWHIAPKN